MPVTVPWPSVAAAAASLLSGVAVVASRYVVVQLDPLALAQVRYLLATLTLAPLVVVLAQAPLARRDLWPVLFLGASFFGVFTWTFNVGLQFAPAARGAVVVSSMPAITLALAALMRYEQVTLSKLGGVVLAFLGVALTVSDREVQGVSSADLLRGDLFLVGAAFCGAVFNVMSRPFLGRYEPVTVAFWAMAGGALLLLPFTAFHDGLRDVPDVTLDGWVAVAILAVPCSAVAFTLWIWALRQATPTRVAVFFTLSPVAATIFGALVLREAVPTSVLAGLAAVIGGIVLTNWRREPTAVVGLRPG